MRGLPLVLLALTLAPAFAAASDTGDMFGDRGYVPATFWSPPLHSTADMFPHDYTYVGSNADLFGHAAPPGAFGVEDLFAAHDMGGTPDTPLFVWPGDPYPQ